MSRFIRQGLCAAAAAMALSAAAGAQMLGVGLVGGNAKAGAQRRLQTGSVGIENRHDAPADGKAIAVILDRRPIAPDQLFEP